MYLRQHIFVRNNNVTIEWIEGIGTKHILWTTGRTYYATGMEIQYQHTLCAADSEGNILYSFDTDYLGIHNNNCQWEPIAIDNVSTDKSSVSKLLRDGQLIIKFGDNLFNAEGLRIK